MTRWVIVAVLLIVGAPVALKADSVMTDLNEYLWSNRLIVVFAGNATDPNFKRQMSMFAGHGRDIDDRRLVILPVTGVSRDAQDMRRRFGVAADAFRVFLIGLDGGIKRHSRVPVAACDLFAQIDAMPMRRLELATAGHQSHAC